MPLILRTLVRDGRLAKGAVSITTVTRLYREAKLPRGVRPDGHTRLRWQADHPGALWHGDELHREPHPDDPDDAVTAAKLVDHCGRLLVALDAHRRQVRAPVPSDQCAWPF